MAWATVEQIAQVLNLTPRRVQQIVREGMPRQGRGEYDLITCVHWYIASLEKRIQETETGMDLVKEKARLTAMQADAATDRLLLSRGHLIRVEELLPAFDRILAAFKDNMLGRGRKIASECGGKTQSEIAQMIEDFDRSMLQALSDQFAQMARWHGDLSAKRMRDASRKRNSKNKQ